MPRPALLVLKALGALVLFVAIALAVYGAAMVAFFLFLYAVDSGHRLLFDRIVRPEVLVPAFLGCLLLLGVTEAWHWDRVWLRRAMGVVLVLLAVAALVRGPGFSADRFRTAALEDDLARLEVESFRAVDDRALIGFTADEARQALDAPDEIARRGRVWIWYIGAINDLLGPGDDAHFILRFDASRSRVTSAAVE